MKVAVIGAGFAGLVAARELARGGAEVLVLESAGRVGGRVLTERSALGTAVDLGAMWVGADHARLTALAAETGTSVFPTPTDGAMAYLIGGKPRTRLPLSSVIPAGIALLALPRSRSDRVTVADRIARVPGAGARELLEAVLSEAMAADTDQVSLAALRAGVRGAGGLRAVLGISGGAQDSLFTDGAGGLAERLAADLDIRLDCPALSVRRGPAGVAISTPTGVVRADRAVIAVPPPVARAIRHDPPLPPERAAVERGTVMGVVYKAIAVYERPFWREDGWSGHLLSPSGPVPAGFDVSPPGAGHLGVLVAGRKATALSALAPGRRRAVVLGELAAAFGPAALSPASWHEKSWHEDRHVGGGYSAVPVPGAGQVLGPTPAAGPVHWAGTETAPEHAGYLEGAIASGQAAAAEVSR